MQKIKRKPAGKLSSAAQIDIPLISHIWANFPIDIKVILVSESVLSQCNQELAKYPWAANKNPTP